MKRLTYLLSALMCLVLLQACSAPRDFSELSRTNGVSMAYFGPGMTDMIGGAIRDVLGANVSLGNAKITGLRIITAENGGAVKRTHAVTMAEIRALGATPVMELAKGGNKDYAAVYGKVNPATGAYSHIVFMGERADRSVTLILQGNITGADIQGLAESDF